MREILIWVSGKDASKILRVDEKNLELLRIEGYLRPGAHWRSSNDPEQLPWKPKVFYCVCRCKEVIDSLKEIHYPFKELAA